MAVENPNEDEKPFTPELLESLAKHVEDFRADTLFGVDGGCAEPFAEQHYLAALAHLELAHREFMLAMYHQRRSLV